MTYPALMVLDRSFSVVGMIDSYTSFQAERRLWEVGEMELHAGLLVSGADSLQVGNIITLIDGRAWEITEVTRSEGREGTVSATGGELKGVLRRRLVVPDKVNDQSYFGWDRFPAFDQPDAPAESIIKHYVRKHAVQPEDPARAFPLWSIRPDQGRGVKTRWSDRFKPVTEVLEDVGNFSGMGYTVTADFASKCFWLDVIPEKEQTIGSDQPICFSLDYENIQSLSWQTNDQERVTVAYAGGPGIDESRLIQQVWMDDESQSLTGFDRYEHWLDLNSAEDVDDLEYEAKHELSKLKKVDVINCRALPNSTFSYLKDWDIGSVVTVQSNRLGIQQNKKITGVREVYERGRADIDITFGIRRKNLIDEIKGLKRRP